MTATDSTEHSPKAVISFPGYGILFFWQLGILQYLEDTFDLSQCTMVGSSAGAMLSILAACNVQPQKALDRAHELCIEYGVFDRPLGLIGVWGAMVRQWLQDLLPADAAQRCSGGHVRVVVTTLPFFSRQVVSEFKDRDDLIGAAMASAHLPFILNWCFSAAWRGQQCVDGSLLYILTRRCHGLKPCSTSTGCPVLLFDPLSDRQLLSISSLLRCISLCGKDAAQDLLNQGVTYAHKLNEAGGFAALPRKQCTAVSEPPSETMSDAAQYAGGFDALACKQDAVLGEQQVGAADAGWLAVQSCQQVQLEQQQQQEEEGHVVEEGQKAVHHSSTTAVVQLVATARPGSAATGCQ